MNMRSIFLTLAIDDQKKEKIFRNKSKNCVFGYQFLFVESVQILKIITLTRTLSSIDEIGFLPQHMKMGKRMTK